MADVDQSLPDESPPNAKPQTAMEKDQLEKEIDVLELEHGNRKMEFGELVFGDQIGKGGVGLVFKGSWKHWNHQVAIKQVCVGDSVKEEILTLCELKHPNIIKLYGTASRHPHMYLVTELAELGSLYGYINSKENKGKPNVKLSLHWAIGIAKGMCYLHEKEVVHRDLKSLNVLLTSGKVAKICDFGTARQLDHTTQASMVGTTAWMAPEVILQAKYNKSCDLFSFGMVLWELATHEVPYEELHGVPFEIQKAITSGERPRIPDVVDTDLSKLMQRCWSDDPKARPPFVDILSDLNKVRDLFSSLDHENRRMEHADLVFGEKIGQGTVYKGCWKDWEVTIKQVPLDEGIEEEIRMLSALKHPSIIKLYGTASKPPHMYIVAELAEGSLYKHIQQNKDKPDMELSLRWAIGIARGMSYLHEKEVVHRDLKSLNVLLTSGKVAKICDFGTARQLDHTTQASMVGTTAWMAPEVMKKGVYSKASDMFSFGIILWELMTHEVPFEELTSDQIQTCIVEGKRPEIPECIEFVMSKLIQDCWTGDPEKRLSFVEALPVLEQEELFSMQEHEHENREMELDDLVFGDPIKDGGSSAVFKGRWKCWNHQVAIKRLPVDSSSTGEIRALSALKHPNIIKLYGTAFKHPHLCIVTELAELGSLYGHIQKNKSKPDMELSLHWAIGIARGMSYLHEKEVVHENLKSLNVLLTSRKTAKICDVVAVPVQFCGMGFVAAGTSAWSAPEVIQDMEHSKSTDVFSFGMVLWELVTHEVPFGEPEMRGNTFRIQMAIVNGQLPTIPDVVEMYQSTLIQSCWSNDAKRRPSFVDILSVLKTKEVLDPEAEPEEGSG